MNRAEMNGDATLVNRIAGIFADMQVQVTSADTDLFGDGNLDSLAFLKLLVRLEQEFEMKCNADDLEIDNFRTIARIAEFVRSRAQSCWADITRSDSALLPGSGR